MGIRDGTAIRRQSVAVAQLHWFGSFDSSHVDIRAGPVIRAVVGDKVEVHFLNKLSFPVSLQVTGLLYSSAVRVLLH